MVTKNQVMTGLINYIDNEVIEHLEVGGKWLLGAGVILLSKNIEQSIDTISKNDFLVQLGIVNSDGDFDVEKLSSCFQESAQKYGKLEINLPIIGEMRFSADDIRLLEKYMRGENK